MSYYERAYGDWDALDKDEATERAYAIGVAERLGEDNREALETIYAEMDSAYAKSMVELAYDEGRREATEAASADVDDDALWSDLVEGEPITIDPGDVPTGGRDGLPEALSPSKLIQKYGVDSTDAVDRPDFLER